MHSIALKELAQAIINIEASAVGSLVSPVDMAVLATCRSFLNA